MKDGGLVTLDWAAKNDPRCKNLVIILHGLTGGSDEDYLQDLIVELTRLKYNSVVMNYRGCASSPVITPQLYSGGFTEDIRGCINHILNRDPSTRIFGVGYSLGANILTKYVGEEGVKCKLIGFASVAGPYDLMVGMRALHRSWMGKNLYSRRLASNLIRIFSKHEHIFENSELDVSAIRKVKTL